MPGLEYTRKKNLLNERIQEGGLDKLHIATEKGSENYQAGKNHGNHMVQHADFTDKKTKVLESLDKPMAGLN